jgi:hypothetical protein
VATLRQLKKRYGPPVKKPEGVPKVPWPPHQGATRNWDRRTKKLALLVEYLFGITCSTYPWHGSNAGNGGGSGERNAFDAWVHYPGSRANAVQEAYGYRIQNFIENNFNLWFYQIWWNRMRYYYGAWFSYEPYWRDYVNQSGNPNPADNRHRNHVHTQDRKGIIGRALSRLALALGIKRKPQTELERTPACVIPNLDVKEDQEA